MMLDVPRSSLPRLFRTLPAVLLALGAAACGSSPGGTGSSGSGGGAGGGAVTIPGAYVFSTDEYVIQPGEEKYMCYTTTLDQAMNVDRFVYNDAPGVHHLVLVNPLVAEQAGSFECDVLFKETWLPIYANGTGSADVSTPPGAAFKLTQGEQLLIQLHLLNATKQPIQGKASLQMHPNADANLVAAGIYGFGTQKFSLPPQMQTTVQNDCAIDRDLQIFGGFPHMHKLGQGLTFWSGNDASSLTKQFSVDSWAFGEQKIYPLSLTLKNGTMTRVTCAYDNTTANTVSFGETTADEMCYFVVFVAPYLGLDGCVNL